MNRRLPIAPAATSRAQSRAQTRPQSRPATLTALALAALAITALTLTACRSDRDSGAPVRLDPETTARAFFTTHGDINAYKNQKIRIDKGSKTVECNVVDTCADADCDGCCTENAGASGYLIDMEYWTVLRDYGEGQAYGQVCFQLA